MHLVVHPSTFIWQPAEIPVSDPSFPASVAFDQVEEILKKSDVNRKEAIQKANAIFAFCLKNKEGKEKTWYIDLKNKGEVGQGSAPVGDKATGESILLGLLIINWMC